MFPVSDFVLFYSTAVSADQSKMCSSGCIWARKRLACYSLLEPAIIAAQ